MKVNKPSRCHNQRKHELLSDPVAANSLIQRSYIKYFQFAISCPSREPSCNHALVIAPQFFFFCCTSLFPVLPFIVDHRGPKTCVPKTCLQHYRFRGQTIRNVMGVGVGKKQKKNNAREGEKNKT